ncbi:MAG: site-2 protease family protein [Anaerolineae bacterium]|nr:site-2 protease family protein [Anaerolineae bacterium]
MRGFTIGRIAGIRIRIDWSWIIIFLLVAWTLAVGYFPALFPNFSTALNWVLGIVSSFLLFASVLVHELAHSFVARSQGLPVESITLFIFGGVSEIEEEPRTAGNEFRMAFVGPLTSLALAAVFWGIYLGTRAGRGPVAAVVQYLAVINLALGIFNLFPGFPLDGGRVLRAILWAITDNLRRATRIASYVGQGFAFLLIFAGVALIFSGAFISGIWLAFIGWFLNNAASASYRELVVRQSLEGVPVRRLMATDVDRVPPTLTVQQVIDEHILSGRQHAYPVQSDGELVGLICLHDVRNVPQDARATVTVAEAMTPYDRLVTSAPEEDLASAVDKLGRGGYEQLPVLDAPRHLAGLLRRRDVINYLQVQTDLEGTGGGSQREE